MWFPLHVWSCDFKAEKYFPENESSSWKRTRWGAIWQSTRQGEDGAKPTFRWQYPISPSGTSCCSPVNPLHIQTSDNFYLDNCWNLRHWSRWQKKKKKRRRHITRSWTQKLLIQIWWSIITSLLALSNVSPGEYLYWFKTLNTNYVEIIPHIQPIMCLFLGSNWQFAATADTVYKDTYLLDIFPTFSTILCTYSFL